MELTKYKIAVVGLGYVGLPLAVAFSKKYKVFGFDINNERIEELNLYHDKTLEIGREELVEAVDIENLKSIGLHITSSINKIKECNVFIITVPTPVDKNNRPDLSAMINSSTAIGAILKKGDIVIYESTVFPGVTEEIMVPVLERASNLKFNIDFFCGYSPERINPGDKEHTVTDILKVTSGSTAEIAEMIDQLYKSVIVAGTYKASSIKVAEAAKVIENSQRDINIAFVNELSKIFNLIGIDTNEVLSAAGTKWNFLNFKPGLVGGHCIGVDPFYLAHKAQEYGYHPEIILAGRRLNDSMGRYVATEVIKLLIRKNLMKVGSKVLILGFSFKENCPDVRNTRVIDIYNELISFNVNVEIYDPLADFKEVEREFSIRLLNELPNINKYSAVILAVSHKMFSDICIQKNDKLVVFDVKGLLPKSSVDARL